MALFSIDCNQLVPVKEKKIELERDIQRLTENNLADVFGLAFVRTEFELHRLRIDTLAFDDETNSFVIIEYKRDRSFSVVDQGFAYLALMLNNKADFILEYNENCKSQIKREDVNWEQSRVIFVANSFTTYQQEAINFKDLPIELWEVKKYDNNSILFNQLRAAKATESIKAISKNETVNRVSREVKTYSVDDHFKTNWQDSRQLFDELRPRLLEIDGRLEESPQKQYIGYKINNSIVFALISYKSGISLELNRVEPKDVKDPDKALKYVKNSFKYFHKHISAYWITSADQIDYAVYLAKQLTDNIGK